MQKLIDEVKINWKDFFKSLLVTKVPDNMSQILNNTDLPDEARKALDESLKNNDNFGEKLFDYNNEENEVSKASEKIKKILKSTDNQLSSKEAETVEEINYDEPVR